MTAPTSHWKRLAVSAAALTIALAFGGTASAKRGKRGKSGKHCVPTFMKAEHDKFDANKDGKLSHGERLAMMQAHHAAALAKYDADGDGELNDQERKKLRYDKMVEHFEALDTNRDAEIARAEAKGSCTPLERRFDDIDTDDDSSISWAEFEKAAPRRGMHGPGGMRGIHGPDGKHGPRGERGVHGKHGKRGKHGSPPDEAGDAE